MKAIATARTCRRCKCTDARACPGGCYWVEADLCSRCADEPPEPLIEKEHGTAD